MAKGGLRIYHRSDGILVFEIRDTKPETVKAWEKAVTEVLDACTDPEKHLQDLRQLQAFSLYAFRVALRLKAHRNLNNVFVAVLTQQNRTMELSQLIIKIQPGGTFRLMHDEAEAVAWLNEQVP